MSIDPIAALWFLPFVVPLCLYTCYTDMARMKITNKTVVALFAVYAVIGLIALPFETYLWGYAHLIVVLLVGMALNALGAMGAGDAKFAAAAAPFIHLGDLRFLLLIFVVVLVAALIAHRVARASPLTRLAPDWASWHAGTRFPMGLALGPTLALYLAFGALQAG